MNSYSVRQNIVHTLEMYQEKTEWKYNRFKVYQRPINKSVLSRDKENSWISSNSNSAKAFVPKHANREVIEILSEDDLELEVDIRLKCKADQNTEISQKLTDSK